MPKREAPIAADARPPRYSRDEDPKVWVVQDGAKCQQVGFGIQYNSSINVSYRSRIVGGKIQNALVSKQIMKLILRALSLPMIFPWRGSQQVGIGNQAARCCRIIKDDEKSATAILRQVQRGNEKFFRQLGVTESLTSKTEFFDCVCDPAASIQKSKNLHSI